MLNLTNEQSIKWRSVLAILMLLCVLCCSVSLRSMKLQVVVVMTFMRQLICMPQPPLPCVLQRQRGKRRAHVVNSRAAAMCQDRMHAHTAIVIIQCWSCDHSPLLLYTSISMTWAFRHTAAQVACVRLFRRVHGTTCYTVFQTQ